jgi:hypothetical protein
VEILEMITLSCGHRVKRLDDGYDVVVREYAHDWSKAVAYKVVCSECKDAYEKQGYILHTEDEVNEWLEMI